jgi:energy-coupling factor transporter ATP-binding protein EcfA2
MIKSITIKRTGAHNFTNKLYHNKNKDVTYEFTDGVNIVTGRNGSGKSVLLNLIKTSCGGTKDVSYPTMPNPFDAHPIGSNIWHTMPEIIKKRLKNRDYPNTDISWDGTMFHHLTADFFNPKAAWDRLDNPMQVIKNELFSGGESLSLMMSNNSKGESAIGLLIKLYDLGSDFERRLTKRDANDVWVKSSDVFHDWLESFTSEKGKPTLLIDELDTHLDLDNQKVYWDYINHLTKKWQVIVVSHSIFAFHVKDANYINLNPEYYNKVKKIIL